MRHHAAKTHSIIFDSHPRNPKSTTTHCLRRLCRFRPIPYCAIILVSETTSLLCIIICSLFNCLGVTDSATQFASPPALAKKMTSTTEESLRPAECWICLDEGLDESGKPLVRDCSCRGTTGFAHLSCIVKYAEQKWRYGEIEDPWGFCPNCHQLYRNKLSLDMSSAHVSFVEKNYPNEVSRRVEALFSKTRSLYLTNDDNLFEEGKQMSYKVLSLIENMDTKSAWMLHIKSCVYRYLGDIAFSKGSSKEAVGHYEKYEGICKEAGYSTSNAEIKIARAKAADEGGKALISDETLKISRDMYGGNVKKFGEDSNVSLQSGVSFAADLKNAYHSVEAERLLSKLVITSHRVHGPDHDLTKTIASHLQVVKMRFVHFKHKGRMQDFQALRSEGNGKKYVVQGPFSNPLNTNEGKVFVVPSDNFFLTIGTPGVCHGLKNALHLNGKIGDVREFHIEKDRYEVHFEDTKLKPCLVKRDNVKILYFRVP